MNKAIKIVSKTLMTKISHISWGGYDKGLYDNCINNIWRINNKINYVC